MEAPTPMAESIPNVMNGICAGQPCCTAVIVAAAHLRIVLQGHREAGTGRCAARTSTSKTKTLTFMSLSTMTVAPGVDPTHTAVPPLRNPAVPVVTVTNA